MKPKTMGICAFVCGLFLLGCGGAQTVEKKDTKCEDNCNLAYMTCMDEDQCAGAHGTQVPCLEECENKKTSCMSNCEGQ